VTIKVLCSCDHKGQDKLHGEKIRVYNECISKTPSKKRYRCTVCGREIER